MVEAQDCSKQKLEFGTMSRTEKLKVLLAKIVALAFIGIGLVHLVEGQPIHCLALRDAASILAGSYVYMNLFSVKTTLRNLFEPPYRFEGDILAYAAGVLLAASTYYQIADLHLSI